MVRLIFILILITFKTFSQASQFDSLMAQFDITPFNLEIKRVSNNWVLKINKGIDTNNYITKKLLSNTYHDGQLKYYKTKEGYSKIIKTYTTTENIKIIFYSLGTWWPLQIETYINEKNTENLYFDKTNLMAWEKGENQFVEMMNRDFFPTNKQTSACDI